VDPRSQSTVNGFKIVTRGKRTTRDKRTPLDDMLPISKVQAFAKMLGQTKPEFKGDALSSNYIRSLTDAIASPLALVAQVPQDPAEVAAIVEEWIKAGTRPNVAAALSGSIADLIRRTEPTGIPSPIDKPRAIAAQTDAMLTLSLSPAVSTSKMGGQHSSASATTTSLSPAATGPAAKGTSFRINV
jgi:hypothetical protein